MISNFSEFDFCFRASNRGQSVAISKKCHGSLVAPANLNRGTDKLTDWAMARWVCEETFE